MKCHCHKRGFNTKKLAQNVHANMVRGTIARPVEFYQCDNGLWHWK